jgi:hypothetical protein
MSFYSFEGKTFLKTSFDKPNTFSLMNATSNELIREFKTDYPFDNVKFCPNQNLIASSSSHIIHKKGKRRGPGGAGLQRLVRDSAVTMWDATTGAKRYQIDISNLHYNDDSFSDEEPSVQIIFSLDGVYMCVIVAWWNAHIYKVANGELEQKLYFEEFFRHSSTSSDSSGSSGSSQSSSAIRNLAQTSTACFSPENTITFAFLNEENNMTCLTYFTTNYDTPPKKTKIDMLFSNLLDMAYSPDGSKILMASENAVTLWDVKRFGKKIKTVKGHPHTIGLNMSLPETDDTEYKISFSPSGHYFGVGDEDRLYLFDTKTGRQIQEMKVEGETYPEWAFSGNNFAYRIDNKIHFWRLDRGAVLEKLASTGDRKQSVTLNNNSKTQSARLYKSASNSSSLSETTSPSSSSVKDPLKLVADPANRKHVGEILRAHLAKVFQQKRLAKVAEEVCLNLEDITHLNDFKTMSLKNLLDVFAVFVDTNDFAKLKDVSNTDRKGHCFEKTTLNELKTTKWENPFNRRPLPKLLKSEL